MNSISTVNQLVDVEYPYAVCSFCLAFSANHNRDRHGKPYVVCPSCGARSFLRKANYGPVLLELVVDALGEKRLGYLMASYGPDLVVQALSDELKGLLDSRITDNVERAVYDLAAEGSAASLASHAEVAEVAQQMDDLMDDLDTLP